MISLPAAAVDGDATIYLEPNLRASQFCRLLEIVLDWTFWFLEFYTFIKAFIMLKLQDSVFTQNLPAQLFLKL